MGDYSFCGVCFCKIQCNHCLAGNLSFQPKFKVNLPWKRQKSFEFKIPSMFSKIALYPLIKSIFAQHQSCRSLKFEQLSCWELFHLSFSLKVITGLQFSPWNFWKLQNRPYPLLPPPCSASRRCPPTAPPAGAFPAFPAITSPCAGAHASRTTSSTAL